MLIVFYVMIVWLKIIIGTGVVFLWMWIARDRGVTGPMLLLNAMVAMLAWAAPWVMFLWTRADLYHGKCGLRLGVRDCGLIEYLWGDLRWFRVGLMLDILLLVGVFIIIFRARLSTGTNSGALGAR